MMTEPVTIWTIYDKTTKDFPGQFVLRKHYVGPKGEVVADLRCELFDSVDEARSRMPHGLTNLGRRPDDDAVILESWI